MISDQFDNKIIVERFEKNIAKMKVNQSVNNEKLTVTFLI